MQVDGSVGQVSVIPDPRTNWILPQGGKFASIACGYLSDNDVLKQSHSPTGQEQTKPGPAPFLAREPCAAQRRRRDALIPRYPQPNRLADPSQWGLGCVAGVPVAYSTNR
jgi:hypothetical protein